MRQIIERQVYPECLTIEKSLVAWKSWRCRKLGEITRQVQLCASLLLHSSVGICHRHVKVRVVGRRHLLFDSGVILFVYFSSRLDCMVVEQLLPEITEVSS